MNTENLCLGCMHEKGNEKVCKNCGFDSTCKNGEQCLPAKFLIDNRYLVGKATGVNGESICYIGFDTETEQIVSIREYFPEEAAKRNPDKSVSIIKGKEYAFNESLMNFLELNKNLMAIDGDEILPVVSVFEENGTAYTIYGNLSAITLREFLTRNGGALKWEQAKPLFSSLLDTVSRLHNMGIIHRGISPETVIVGRDGRLHLTGICVKNARMANSLIKPQLYSGYAAPEQYGISGMTDGEHTDVYGICATLFRTLIGTVPPEATARIENDNMTVSAKAAQTIPHNVLAAIANGLQIGVADRTKSVSDLKAQLIFAEMPNPEAEIKQKQKVNKSIKQNKNEEEIEEPKKAGGTKSALIAAGCTLAVITIIGGIFAWPYLSAKLFNKKSNNESVSSKSYVSSFVSSSEESEGSEVELKSLFAVPDFSGMYLSAILENDIYKDVTVVVKDKEFSDKFKRGMIVSQSVVAGTQVEKGTTVEVVISLGTSDIQVANVLGLDETSAKMELLKQGFLYENIKVVEKYNIDENPSTVLEQEPSAGTTISTDAAVTIYVNSYKGE